jgi:glycine cleavage system H lipoate-binding protein/ABC-type phosphate transport system substrate-binding protein
MLYKQYYSLALLLNKTIGKIAFENLSKVNKFLNTFQDKTSLNTIVMKKTTILLISLLLLNFSFTDSKNVLSGKSLSVDKPITVFCSPDLYNLSVAWASEFCTINPAVEIQVMRFSESRADENLKADGYLGFISSEYSEMYDESAWNIVVGRDIIVPIFNSDNPFMSDINQQGISAEELAQAFNNGELRNWGTLLNSQKNIPVNFYMINDESINSGMAKLLNIDQVTIEGIKVDNAEELLSAVRKDLYSIGICKMTNILDFTTQGTVEGIKLLPIDRNGNGKVDYMEKIYDDLNVLSRGIWIGKYPNALFNNIYSVSSVKPTNETEVAFLKWVLTDGQKFLNSYGYSDLLFSERQSKVGLFDDSDINIISTNENFASSRRGIVILGSFIVFIFLVITAIQYIKNRKMIIPDTTSDPALVFGEDFVDIPLGLYYDKTHTWAFMEKDGMVRVGIDDFLQHITGPLTRIKMKRSGEKIRKGKQILSIIQNGKQLNIYSPISGTIKEQNKVLEANSSIINSSPYSDGWVYRIEPTNWIKEIQFLIIGKKYKEWVRSEFSRLKEFLSESLKPNAVEYAKVLQDGGEIKDGILMDLSPEVWEDFQTNFIDMSR